MNRQLTIVGLLALTACSKPASQEQSQAPDLNANNSMTRYVGGLQSDVQQAQNAVDKMNRGIAKSETKAEEAANLGQ